MKIVIFGTGYVGLVTGTCFAEMGNYVTCIDIDKEKINNLNKGILPIYEPGLDELIEQNVDKRRLYFTTESKDAIQSADIIFIAVGTPPEENGSADLKYVLGVARNIAEHLNEYKVIVNKSTVPVGTEYKVSEEIKAILNKRGVDISYDVVSNPEFLKEGTAIADCMHPDRIIVGTEAPQAISVMQRLYAPFDRNKNRLIFMDVISAEMTKYVANAMLATKISFMNEMSQISERVGADIEKIRIGIGADKRIGYHFISPGCGYGGSCFPKDIIALNQTAKDHNYKANILQAIDLVNKEQKMVLFDKADAYFKGNLAGKTFAIWGVSFKPDTDDIREASARILIENLWKSGAKVNIYDPEAMYNFDLVYKNKGHDYTLAKTPNEALIDADGLFVLTEWSCFKSPDFNKMSLNLAHKVIFDGRNLYDKDQLANLGFNYLSIGR